MFKFEISEDPGFLRSTSVESLQTWAVSLLSSLCGSVKDRSVELLKALSFLGRDALLVNVSDG